MTLSAKQLQNIYNRLYDKWLAAPTVERQHFISARMRYIADKYWRQTGRIVL